MHSVSYSYSPLYLITYEGDFKTRFKRYLREPGLVEYGAGMICNAIADSCNEQIKEIQESSKQISVTINDAKDDIVESIKYASEKIYKGITDLSKEIGCLDKKLDIVVEQQRMSNMLLSDIIELLKIPEVEKERLQYISLGIQFFIKAKTSHEFYSDSLYYFLKAEELQQHDSFVLNHIGLIYLFVDYLLDPEKAKDYFLRAAKYAEIDYNSYQAFARSLINPQNMSSSERPTSAADLYEKAAFASYVLEDIESALECQKKAVELNDTPLNRYNLAKYEAHNGGIDASLEDLSIAIELLPNLIYAVPQEAEFVVCPKIMKFIAQKNDELDARIKWYMNESEDEKTASLLFGALNEGTYNEKRRVIRRLERSRVTFY